MHLSRFSRLGLVDLASIFCPLVNEKIPHTHIQTCKVHVHSMEMTVIQVIFSSFQVILKAKGFNLSMKEGSSSKLSVLSFCISLNSLTTIYHYNN